MDYVINKPDIDSTDTTWIAFFDEIKGYLGKAGAKKYWVAYWTEMGGEHVNANTKALRTYMAKQGITVDESMVASITDTVTGIFDFSFGFIETGLKVAGGLILLIVVGAVYSNFRTRGQTFNNVAKTGAKVAMI